MVLELFTFLAAAVKLDVGDCTEKEGLDRDSIFVANFFERSCCMFLIIITSSSKCLMCSRISAISSSSNPPPARFPDMSLIDIVLAGVLCLNFSGEPEELAIEFKDPNDLTVSGIAAFARECPASMKSCLGPKALRVLARIARSMSWAESS